MFFDGLSPTKISEQLQGIYSDNVNPSTIYRWIMEYSQKATELLKGYKLNVGNTWVVDETGIDINGRNMWFWDIIDERTRFLLASHISSARTIEDVAIVLKKAWDRAGKYPDFILSDKWLAYNKGFKRVFGSHAIHIKSQGFTAEINTNLIERFHGTLKERTKVLRAFKSVDTAKIILDGFVINYNFFRPHMTLKNTTPAQEAGTKLPFKTWEGLLRELQHHLT
jgi:transposase-like protein